MDKYLLEVNGLLASPCTRYKLKDAILAFDTLDPVDALHDAETLLHLMQTRVNQMQKESR